MSAEAAPQAEAESRQNGAGRKPRADEAPAKEPAKHERDEVERVFETIDAASEQPAKSSEARAEAQAEPEAPRRRGWWQR